MSKEYLEKFDEETRRLQRATMKVAMLISRYNKWREENSDIPLSYDRIVMFLEEHNIIESEPAHKIFMSYAKERFQ